MLSDFLMHLRVCLHGTSVMLTPATLCSGVSGVCTVWDHINVSKYNINKKPSDCILKVYFIWNYFFVMRTSLKSRNVLQFEKGLSNKSYLVSCTEKDVR